MGPGETIGLIAVCGVALALLGWGTELVKRYLAFKEQQLAFKAQDRSSGLASAEIEDRLRVLEKIVTDRGFDVAHQIEALRDMRRADELVDARREGEKL